jgi:UDP-4-amino-4,6-dideoxy-N-acetyl-beta-L-altrosamine N-acetyltransferase
MPLRRIQQEDLELMLSWRNHQTVRLGMFSQSVIEIEQHRAWFRRESEKETSVWLLYVDTEENPAGVVYFTDIDSISSNALWGFYAAPGAKLGTGTRMGVEALDYFFVEEGFHKVNADVLETNQRSHKFHRKLGFQTEGVFRDQYLGKDSYESVTRFGLLESEWVEHRKTFESI